MFTKYYKGYILAFGNNFYLKSGEKDLKEINSIFEGA